MIQKIVTTQEEGSSLPKGQGESNNFALQRWTAARVATQRVVILHLPSPPANKNFCVERFAQQMTDFETYKLVFPCGLYHPFFLSTGFCALLFRDIAFEGYTDALTVKLMNKGLSARNLTIRCSVPNVVRWNMYCHPLYDGDCTNTGFEVCI